MAETVNLTLKIGIDKRYDCTILNKAKTEAVDITGWALSWMVKRKATDLDAAALFVKTTAGGAITITGAYNVSPTVNLQLARVSIADEDTAALTPSLYVYELKRTDAGFETPLLEGTINFTYAVHRA